MRVRDSKKILPEKRKEMIDEIKKIADDYIVLKISSKQLNKEMERRNLNEIEITRIAQIINSFWMRKPKIYLDSVEANTEKFRRKILEKLKDKEGDIVAENEADNKYVVVGGASILAKVTRDKEIEKLHGKYGQFGSGYSSDERTIEFLKKLDKESYNEIVRLKWVTSKNILEEKSQRKLGDY